MAMLFTKVKMYLEENSKTWEDEQNNIELVDDGVNGETIKTWNVDGLSEPSTSKLDSYNTNAEKEERNNVVGTTRKKLYGDLGDQLDEIFKDIDSWKARVQQIKNDNPKE